LWGSLIYHVPKARPGAFGTCKQYISKIPTNTSLEELTSTRLSEDVWVTYFGTFLAWQSDIRVVTGLNPSEEVSSWEVLDTPRIESYGQARDAMQTPRQLKLEHLLLATVDRSSSGLLDIQEIPTFEPSPDDATFEEKAANSEERLKDILSNWKTIAGNFRMIILEFDQNGREEMKYREVVNSSVAKIQDAIHALDSKIQLLETRIGTKNVKDGTVSLWEAVGELRENAQEITDALASQKADVARTKQDGVRGGQDLDNMSESFQNLTAHYRKHFPLIGNRLKLLEQQERPKSRGSQGVRWEGFHMDEGLNQSFTQELDTIRDRTRALETRLDRWDAPCRQEFNDLEEGI
jgi:hypothetical protein